MSNLLNSQAVQTQQLEWLRANPKFTTAALKAINRWGNEKLFLQYAVAQGMQEVYEAGQQGEDLPDKEPPKLGLIRRSRPVPIPAQPSPVQPIRRRKP